jgi:hypothetical protein
VHHHNLEHPDSATSSEFKKFHSQSADAHKKADDISADGESPVIKALANASLAEVDAKHRSEEEVKGKGKFA